LPSDEIMSPENGDKESEKAIDSLLGNEEYMRLDLLIETQEVPLKLEKEVPKAVKDHLLELGRYDETNDVYYVPLFVAHELLKRDIATLDIPYYKNLAIPLAYTLEESSSPTLKKLPDNFFIILRERLNILREINKVRPTSRTIDDEKKLKNALSDMIDARIQKIMKSVNKNERVIEYLTLDEKWLFKNILKLYKIWLETMNFDF